MSVLRFDPFRDPFHELDRLTSQLASGTRMPQSVPMDVFRSGDTYHVLIDLPGVDPSTVDLTMERNALTVRAERGPAQSEGDQVLVLERPSGSFTRQLMLGEGLDPEKVQADYTNGVLHLTIPVARSAQPRKIEIGKSGGNARQVIDVGSSHGEQSSNGEAQPSAAAQQASAPSPS